MTALHNLNFVLTSKSIEHE